MNWRRTTDYRRWKIAVIRRDGVCRVCGSRDRREAHHIKNGSHHPESRFDVDNGVCLCRRCHTAFHCDYKNSFREKTSEKDWLNFLSLVIYIKTLT